jgi:outer membrane immunogenic protein
VGGPAAVADGAAGYAPAPPPTWTGFYLGLGVGGDWDKDHWKTGPIIGGPLQIPNDGFTDSVSLFKQRVMGGGFGGYNLQSGKVVIGAEAGIFPSSGVKASVPYIPGTIGTVFVPTIFPGDSASVVNDWDAYFRGRAGVLVTPSTLLYGTAGLALRKTEVNASCADSFAGLAGNWCGEFRNETSVAIREGYTVGAGVESMIGQHIFVRLDYRFSDYGTFHHTFFNNSGGDELPMKLESSSQSLTAGMGIKF